MIDIRAWVNTIRQTLNFIFFGAAHHNIYSLTADILSVRFRRANEVSVLSVYII